MPHASTEPDLSLTCSSDPRSFNMFSLLQQVQDEYEKLLLENSEMKARLSDSSSPSARPSLEPLSPAQHSHFASLSVSESSYTEPRWRTFSSKLFVRQPGSNCSIYTPSVHYHGHSDGIQDLCVSAPSFASNPYLALGSWDSTVTIWNTSSASSAVAVIEKHSGAVNAVKFHGTSPLLLTGSGDKTACIWPLELDKTTSDESYSRSLSPLTTFEHSDVVSSATFMFSDVVGTGSFDSNIYLFSVHSGANDRVLAGHTAEILQLNTLSAHNSTLLVSASMDGTARLWDTRQNKAETCCFGSGVEGITSAKGSPVDATRLVTCSLDKELCIWDIRQPACAVKNINCDGTIGDFALSSTSPLIAVPYESKRIRFYDYSGKKTSSARSDDDYGHTQFITCLAFGWKDTCLFSGAMDGKVVQWNEKLYRS
ncbi:hypothetical protein P9112_004071 [Eukaryota sp. TZLM1-RC]